MGSALNRYRAAWGDAARRLGDALYAADGDDTAWIAACSRLGQDVAAWLLAHPFVLDLEAIGWLWPGPAIYGLGDDEQEPRAGYLLLEAIESGASPRGPLCGAHDVGGGGSASLRDVRSRGFDLGTELLAEGGGDCFRLTPAGQSERRFAAWEGIIWTS